ncbi:MAG: U32 family peptidase [Verrucomicrobiae bacterium]|nr:U32 family peptidase [Verrucomicrobiae bacterium]
MSQNPASVSPRAAGPDGPLIRPELLAPAGDWQCARAAVENGADAIYFGLERFNARMRANNFTNADLPRLMEFLHRRGCRGYVTFNTLVFTDELDDAEQHLRDIIAGGADGVVVQDIGICRLIRRLSPDFPIHASTQMTITSAAGVEFARELGCNLVVLARECSLKDIAAIQAANESQLPLQVFVHGALCIAYSGQCLTSEALGGRSANRGECAQTCRMPFELLRDGQTVPLGDRRYLLSPQDLASVELLPDLIRLGLHSLKIEGRLKEPEYGASVTRVYRQAIDECVSRMAGSGSPVPMLPASPHPMRNAQYDLEMAFSRGLHTGWFLGVNHKQLVHGRFAKKRGVLLGEVRALSADKVVVRLQAPLKPGDGVVFDSGHPEQIEPGGRVYSVDRCGPDTLIGFGRGDVDLKRVHIGDKLWKTSDPQLDRRLRETFTRDRPVFQRTIAMEVEGRAGALLTLIVRDELGHVVQLRSAMPLARAEKHPLTEERLREQLGRLGGTAFMLGEFKNRLEGGLILPVSELNRLRRDAVRQLDTLRAQPKQWTLVAQTQSSARSAFSSTHSADKNARATPELIALVRGLPQFDAALRSGVETVYCEFDDPGAHRDAVARFRQARTRNPKSTIFLVPPRITKPGEDWILRWMRAAEPDGYLVRNYDHLKFFAGCRCVGDFSLNVANPLAAEYFIGRYRLERLTASYDLSLAQLESLLCAAPPAWFEITIHQHMPMFHMEHCVFCAFLSSGTDFSNCGRPCEKHEVKLRDRVGAEHPARADAGCRNTVFNARAQTAAEYVSRLIALGARHFRVEFLNEPPEQVERTLRMYQQLLRGQISSGQLWRELKLLNQLGVTRGQMEKAER